MNRDKIISALAAIGLTTTLAYIATLSSTEFFEVYGSGVFIVAPFVCGFVAAWIYNRKGRKRLGETVLVSTLAACISLVAFLFLGLEGLICIAMAIPSSTDRPITSSWAKVER